jgi:hypothetical protein
MYKPIKHQPKQCIVCGKEFTPKIATNLICSNSCSNLRHKQQVYDREKMKCEYDLSSWSKEEICKFIENNGNSFFGSIELSFYRLNIYNLFLDIYGS